LKIHQIIALIKALQKIWKKKNIIENKFKKNINNKRSNKFRNNKSFEFNYNESMNIASSKKNPFTGTYSKDSSRSSRKDQK